MEMQYWFVFTVLIACSISSVTSRPSDESADLAAATADEVTKPIDESGEDIEVGRGYSYYRVTQPPEELPESTRDILDKIKGVNEQLSKPKREQINYNREEPAEPSYVLDDEAVKQLQQLISSGKLQPLTQQQNNNKFENNVLRNGFSRALPFAQHNIFNTGNIPQQNGINYNPSGNYQPQSGVPYGPMAYMMMNVPVLVPVPANEMFQSYNPNTNRIDSPYTMRQKPFQFQWPLAPFFPIFVKDPLLNYLSGGSWGDLIEYGQSADVCNRKEKAVITKDQKNDDQIFDVNTDTFNPSSRQGRAIKKRTVSHSTPVQLVEIKKTKQQKHSLNLFGNKNKVTKKKPTQPVYEEEEEEAIDTKSRPSDGDLRFPFSDYGLFGNRKPTAPSPGFFINRLKVRRGGVAIAGPGGVATAGRGGTAIVGPGGLAYTQPGGLAVAGPAAKIYALPATTDLSSLVTQLQNQQTPSEDDGEEEQIEEDTQ